MTTTVAPDPATQLPTPPAPTGQVMTSSAGTGATRAAFGTGSQVDAAAGLTVRPLRPGDRETYVRFVAGTSDRTRLLRFGAPKRAMTTREVDRMLDVGHDGAEALAAWTPAGEIVAVARYAPFPDAPGVADVAIVVADELQGRGVGSWLLGQLLERAWVAGYTRLRATTLVDNAAVHGLLRRHGFRTTGTSQGVRSFEAVAR